MSVVKGLFGGGGGDAGDAAKQAADVQAQASREAVEEQRRQFDITQQQLDPYRVAGLPALAQYQALLGLGGGIGGGGAAPLTEDEIRQNLIASGQFSGAGTGAGGVWQPGTDYQSGQPVFIDDRGKAMYVDINDFQGSGNIQADMNQMAEGIRGDWEKYKAGGLRGPYQQELTVSGFKRQSMNNPDQGGYYTGFASPGASTGAGGGITDQEGLDAEIQAQLAQQGQGGQGALDAQQAAIASLVESPGQRFIRDRAQQALLRGSSAVGGLGGGNVRTALTQQGAGFAQQDLQNRYARLQTLFGGGQNAAAQQGAFGQQMASNVGNLLQAGGQATASGILGAQQAQAQQQQQTSGILGAGLGAVGQSFLGPIGGVIGSMFSDERLKDDIQDLDLKMCFEAVIEMPLKSWRYLEEVGLDTNAHFGPMAQEAPDMIRMGEMDGFEMLNLHDELMLLAGALQYMKQEGMLKCH